MLKAPKCLERFLFQVQHFAIPMEQVSLRPRCGGTGGEQKSVELDPVEILKHDTRVAIFPFHESFLVFQLTRVMVNAGMIRLRGVCLGAETWFVSHGECEELGSPVWVRSAPGAGSMNSLLRRTQLWRRTAHTPVRFEHGSTKLVACCSANSKVARRQLHRCGLSAPPQRRPKKKARHFGRAFAERKIPTASRRG